MIHARHDSIEAVEITQPLQLARNLDELFQRGDATGKGLVQAHFRSHPRAHLVEPLNVAVQVRLVLVSVRSLEPAQLNDELARGHCLEALQFHLFGDQQGWVWARAQVCVSVSAEMRGGGGDGDWISLTHNHTRPARLSP